MIQNKWKYVFVVSVLVLAMAIIMALWGFPGLIKRVVNKNLELKEGSAIFDKWQKLPMPISFKVYVFNVTNPEGVAEGDRPNLQEVGPYVYDEYRERIIVNDSMPLTITYNLKKTFIFNQEASGSLTEDDLLTVIHLPYMAALIAVQDIMPSMTVMINKGLEILFSRPEDPFLRVTARELFFDGVYLNCEANQTAALDLICAKLRADSSSNMRPSLNGTGFMFSMFDSMNMTESGPYEISRGNWDIQSVGQITSFEGKTNMSKIWKDDYCGMMNGTDGSVFPPLGDNPPKRLYSFEPEICRSLYISSRGERSVFNITAQYYEMPESALASKSANRDNKCFCRKNWSASHDGCLLMGLLNLNPCKKAPVVASLPHFYLASEELLEYFAGGVQPDEDKHNSYVYLEPNTGAVLQGARRLQFNIELRNIKDIPQVQNVPSGIFPLLWIEEYAQLPDNLVEEVHSALRKLRYANAAKWLLLSLAIVFALGSTAMMARGTFNMLRHKSNSISFVMAPESVKSPTSRKGL